MTILDDILKSKREEVAEARRIESAEALARRASAASSSPTLGFRAALEAGPAPSVIAEIKRRSPSKGEIRADFDPVAHALAYQAAGAAAISVLTDGPFFGGHLDYLRAVREAVGLPLLRKEFVIDPYQIDEARVAGADAILLIVSALSPSELGALHAHALSRGLDVLVEVHDEPELEVALSVGAGLIGVNNRDLATFHTDLAVTERLAAVLFSQRTGDEVTLVAESGIHTSEDVARLAGVGAKAFLVGESLMRQANIGLALERLRRTS